MIGKCIKIVYTSLKGSLILIHIMTFGYITFMLAISQFITSIQSWSLFFYFEGNDYFNKNILFQGLQYGTDFQYYLMF